MKISHAACAWSTPNGQILDIRYIDVKHEAGRIKQYGNLEDQCGIAIERAEEKDNGKWTCKMTYVDQDNNAIPEQKNIGVVVSNNKP